MEYALKVFNIVATGFHIFCICTVFKFIKLLNAA